MVKAWHQNAKRAPKIARTDSDGTVFDSKGELHRWKKLQLWQMAGEIRGLRRQVSFDLVLPDGTPVLTATGKTMQYTADFVYEKAIREPTPYPMRIKHGDDCPWEDVIEDYKGFVGRVEALRIAIFEAIYKKKVTLSGPRKRAKNG